MTFEEVAHLVPFRRASIGLCDYKGDSQQVRTICELIDHNAIANPDHIFCLQASRPASPNVASPLLSITHRQLKTAVSRCAAALELQLAEAHLPCRSEDGSWTISPPVALLAESDITLLIHEFALISLGIPVLLLSARLNPSAVRHLIRETGAVALLVSCQLTHLATEATLFEGHEDQPMPIYPMQSRAEMLKSEKSVHEDFGRHLGAPGYDRGQGDCNVIILHSSGTTGMPKPIYHSHTFLMSFVNCHLLQDEAEAQAINVSTLPLFHGFGLVAPGLSLGIGKIVCLPAPGVPATGASTLALLKQVKAGSLMSVPSILEELCSLIDDTLNLQSLSSLHFVAFGGGILKTTVGEQLALAGVKLLNHYGTTESGPLAPMFAPKDHHKYDWRFFRLRDDIKWEIKEIPATDPTNLAQFKLTTYPYGWGRPFEIQDQLITSPTNPGRDFTAIGRKDAFIALATGEKVDPSFLEMSLADMDEIKYALAFGTGQFELGVLIQPTSKMSEDEEYDALRLSVWRKIEVVNERMDTHARISSPQAILIVQADVQLPRTDKGSIMRTQVYDLYSKEIADLYQGLDEISVSQQSAHPLHFDTLEHDLKNMIQTRLPNWRIAETDWTSVNDLFELGMNSLQVLQFQRILKASVKFCQVGTRLIAEDNITPSFVYQYPSVAAIASALTCTSIDLGQPQSRKERIDGFLSQYSCAARSGSPTVVLLTGATGSLGVHILAHLLADPSVNTVVCLNRASQKIVNPQSSFLRQKEAATSKAISITESQWKKCQVFEALISEPLLGLHTSEYLSLCSRVTHIIHNAWPMNFQQHTASFRPQFRILKNLLALAAQASVWSGTVAKTKLLFVSSIAVVGQYPKVYGETVVPEQPVVNESCTNAMGYAEAKLICERLIEDAMSGPLKTLVETAIVRLGQIAGSSGGGYWNTAEHIPVMLQLSQQAGALPVLSGTFSWTPVDSAATVLCDICLLYGQINGIYHLENPTRQPWNAAIDFFSKQMNNLPQLPYPDWIEMIKSCTARIDNGHDTATQLVDFFERDFEHMAKGSISLETSRARQASQTLSSLGLVSEDVLGRYMRYWRKMSFLKS